MNARSNATLRAYDVLRSRVVLSIRRLAESLDVSVPTATSTIKRLEALAIARAITGKSYGRIFVYDRQLEILNNVGDADTESSTRPRSREDVGREGLERTD